MTIHDKGEFVRRCEGAARVFDCVGAHEVVDGVKWFFRGCDGELDRRCKVFFRSWKKPRYERFLLTVEAVKKDQGGWEVDVVKKVICGV